MPASRTDVPDVPQQLRQRPASARENPGRVWVRAATALGWLAVVVLSLHFLMENALRFVNPSTVPDLRARLGTQYPLFLIHVVAGTLTLLLGPLQFSRTLRTRYLRAHRWTGRAYLLSVLIGGAVGLVLATTAAGGLVGRTGLGMLAVAWLTTGAMAYLSIRRRDIDEHREWMVRNYVVTFAFVIFRIALPPIIAAGYSFEDAFGFDAWLCWALPLLATEVALSLRRQRARSARLRFVQ